MLEPLDRCRRDSTLFQLTNKRLRDFVDLNHLLIQIDEHLDFANLNQNQGGVRICRVWGFRPGVSQE